MTSPLDNFSVYSLVRIAEHVNKVDNGTGMSESKDPLSYIFHSLFWQKDDKAVLHAVFCSVKLLLHMQLDPLQNVTS